MRTSAKTLVMEKISVTLAATFTLEQLMAVSKPEVEFHTVLTKKI